VSAVFVDDDVGVPPRRSGREGRRILGSYGQVWYPLQRSIAGMVGPPLLSDDRSTLTKVYEGELVQATNEQWITKPPTRCPNGHTLGPNQVLVGHQACLGHGGGHTTWTCRTCDATVFGPPLNTHCKTLDGPATVRISNSG
jgi:hypothetical protein